MSEDEYDGIKLSIARNGRNLDRIHQSCAKKLLQGAVEYAKNLGFSSHSDYKKAVPLFGSSIEVSVCPVQYDYGKEGKPFYIRGPNESIREAKNIVNKLHDKCGEGGFDFMIQIDDDF